jgi:hypothetical protein
MDYAEKLAAWKQRQLQPRQFVPTNGFGRLRKMPPAQWAEYVERMHRVSAARVRFHRSLAGGREA